MALLWKKATLPSIEDFARDVAVKKHLTSELANSIRALQQENLIENFSVKDEECDSFCSVLEAIFLHGLKDRFSVSSVFGISSDKMPEINFWTVVLRFSHRNVVSDIQLLSEIKTDIGRCRAWLRTALNDGLIVSYMSTMLSDTVSLQKYYNESAYLRDEEQSGIMKQLLEGISVFSFKLFNNLHILNIWNSKALSLSNLWNPPVVPEPVMPAVDVIDYFTDKDYKSQSKSRPTTSRNMLSESRLVTSTDYDSGFQRDLINGSSVQQSDNSCCEKQDIGDATSNFSSIKETSNVAEENCHEETSSKISSSDSVPDFGLEIIDHFSVSNQEELIGNRLDTKSGWSSSFENSSELKENSESGQSYDSLLESYNKKLNENICGTPEIAGTLTSLMKKKELINDEDQDLTCDARSPDLDFEIIPKFLTTSGADEETKKLLSFLGKICPEQGLDKQNFQCNACGRPVGLIYGKARLCHYDGFGYCYECHVNEEHFIPARIIHNWDFKKYPVSKRTKVFLTRIEEEPLIDMKILNPHVYTAIEAMAHLHLLRTQLSFLRSYLFTCKESAAEELRAKLWPREHLYEHIHLYSVYDLLQVPSAALAQLLQKNITFAKQHVSKCQLCILKGFICELCNNPKAIYPFDVESTYHCERCLSVYHALCMEDNQFCPKCERKRKREEIKESTLQE